MVKIYTLSHPVTGEIRYVGKTKVSLALCLRRHIKSTDIYKYHNAIWVKSILDIGLKPVIELVDEVPVDGWQFWEKYWISQFKTWGFDLTNIRPGGEDATAEQIAKLQLVNIKKGNVPWNKGKHGVQIVWNKGVKMTKEHSLKNKETKIKQYRKLYQLDLTDKKIVRIWDCLNDACRFFKVQKGNLSKTALGKNFYRYGGYHFIYADKYEEFKDRIHCSRPLRKNKIPA